MINYYSLQNIDAIYLLNVDNDLKFLTHNGSSFQSFVTLDSTLLLDVLLLNKSSIKLCRFLVVTECNIG